MIYIISTEVKNGKGGISTALVGLCESLALNKVGYQCITSHSNDKSYFFSAFKMVLKEVNPGDVVWLHCGPWFSLLRKLIISLAAKSRGAKVVFHFHSPKMYDYLNHWFWRRIVKLSCDFADGVIVLTPWWRKQFVFFFPHLSDKLFVSPNPLDNELTLIAGNDKPKTKDSSQVKLLTMGRLVPNKGFQAAINSMTQLPEHYSLSIAGDGPLLGILQNQVKTLGLGARVTFWGWLDYVKKKQILQCHDIFILPSKYDSFGMVFIEAMAYGLPVVALEYQAIPDVIPDGKAGILCGSDNAKLLADAVEDCNNNKKFMSMNGKKHVLENFDKERISERLVVFFKGLSE